VNVKIELMKSGSLNRVIVSSTANDGSYSWTIPSTQTLGTDYKIRITSTSNAAITDSSNSNFAIVAGTLTVTSPNGGQSWKRGTVHTITWSKSGSPGSSIKIELLKGGVFNRVITYSTANDGSYSWKIPSTQTAGTDYKIRITSTTYESISDSSNSNFKIAT
jgi:5-hydroxyisourate hydrolase-like protein (transthyretin family)